MKPLFGIVGHDILLYIYLCSTRQRKEFEAFILLRRNIISITLAQNLAISEGAGGLFDFNATLPLMALQFVLLTTVLTFVYYKPVAKVLEERESLISGNLVTASERLLKADSLYQQYDEQLKDARKNAQGVILEAEKEAKEIVASEINQARKDAASLIDKTNIELEAQKKLALQQLETQIEELSQLIKEKLLGKGPMPLVVCILGYFIISYYVERFVIMDMQNSFNI